jgi:hypothetical protein
MIVGFLSLSGRCSNLKRDIKNNIYHSYLKPIFNIIRVIGWSLFFDCTTTCIASMLKLFLSFYRNYYMKYHTTSPYRNSSRSLPILRKSLLSLPVFRLSRFLRFSLIHSLSLFKEDKKLKNPLCLTLTKLKEERIVRFHGRDFTYQSGS